jgi:hypothetical protein
MLELQLPLTELKGSVFYGASTKGSTDESAGL